jgi:hypothetical protein
MPRQAITINEDTSWERMWASETSGLLRILKPWVSLAILLGFGELYHVLLGRAPVVTWASIGMTLAGTGVSLFAWHVSRLVTAGRAHTAATVAAVALWLTVAMITGPVSGPTGYLLAIFGVPAAFTWNLRSSVRVKMTAAGDAGASAGGRLSAWFADAANHAGVNGTTLTVKTIEPTRAVAQASLPEARTAAELQNKVRNIESGMQFPPGSLTIAEDLDRADKALVTISDPRTLRTPILWPGPSRPGQSIAQPLRPGVWQDGVEVAHKLPGQHLKVMGATGSGKSIGGCWNYCGELVTRYDAAVIALDLAKGNQTWGPLEPALHRFESDRDGIRDVLNTMHKLIPVWTTYLGDHGQQKWTEGCGLSYKVFWLEEAHKIFNALTTKEQENVVEDVLTLRSAGGTIVFSLQLANWTQMPTVVRGQLAHMCFGLNDAADERFGLSDTQMDMGAHPAGWGTRFPGMAYLDCADTPQERLAMPLRTYSWGDDRTAAAAMAEHAQLYPASARPVDEITAAITGGPRTTAGGVTTAGTGWTAPASRPVAALTRAADDRDDQDDDNTYQDDEDEHVLDDYLTTDDPTPELEVDPEFPDSQVDPQDGDEPFEFDTGDPVDPAEARALFFAHLKKLRDSGRTELAARDLRSIMRPGMGRAWMHARLNELVARGELTHDPETRTYQFPNAA